MPRWSSVVAVALQWLVLLCAFVVPLDAVARAQTAPHIAAELVAAGPAAPGGEVMLALHFKPAAGWHGYWSNPGDAGFGMRLEWVLPEGAKAGNPRYPVPQTLVVQGLMNHVFEREYAVLVPLKLPASAAPGTVLPVSVKADWLACTDQICVPERAVLNTVVTVGAAGAPNDPRFAEWTRALPAPLGAQARFSADPRTIRLAIPLPASLKLEEPHLFAQADKLVAYAAPQDFRREGDRLLVTLQRSPAIGAEPAEFAGVLRLNRAGDGVAFTARPGEVPAPAPATPLILLVGLALLGGLILNVMPCVFPILSLKALSLARSGGAGARAEGLAYTAGVVLACAALGALMLVLRAAGEEVGWAFQLQEPAVIAALLLLAVAITANLAGLFEVALPGLSHAGGARGSFATGLLAAFVATPCTGPFMAAAMGAALLLPPLPAILLFVALGLGLALPFLALALIPSLRRLLPRPGAWMNGFRKAMAVPMALTAAALAWLAWRVGGAAFAGLVLAGAGALVALLGIAGKRQHAGLAVGAGPLIAAAALVAGAALLAPLTARAPAPESGGLLNAQPFSEAALAAARAKGPVFLYFTADWCLTCKVNEAAAIDRETTRDAFAKGKVSVLTGDWTRRDPAITRFLESHGAAGVPLYLWDPAGGGNPRVLPQVLTPALLAEAASGNR